MVDTLGPAIGGFTPRQVASAKMDLTPFRSPGMGSLEHDNEQGGRRKREGENRRIPATRLDRMETPPYNRFRNFEEVARR